MTASNVHAMMGMVSEALWTEPNGRAVGCIHATAHPRAGDDPRCPEGISLWKETWRPTERGGLLHCSARELMTIHLEEPADLLDLVGGPLGTTKWMKLASSRSICSRSPPVTTNGSTPIRSAPLAALSKALWHTAS